MNKFIDIKNDLQQEWHEWKYVFVTCLLLNLLAFGFYLVHMTYGVDDYSHIFGQSNTIVSGRWVIDFIHNVVCQTSLLPTITPLICAALYVLSGILICKLWNVHRSARYLTVSLFSIHPYLLDLYNMRFAALSLAIGYFLAIAALFLSRKKPYGMFLSVILLYFAISIYQPVLGFAVAAVMMQVFLACYREGFSAASVRDGGKLFVRYLLVLGLSVVVYLVLTKIIFMVFDVQVNSRFQEGFITDLEQLKAKVGVVISVLIVRLGPIKEFVLPFISKLAIFVIYMSAVIAVLQKNVPLRVRLGVLMWLLLIPPGAVCFMLPLVSHDMPWRICMGLVVFFAGMFALTQESDSLLIRRTGLALGGFLIVYFILNNNTILYKQHLTNQADLIMGNRIIAKMQSLEDYQPGMELAIVGRIEKETFSKESKTNLEIIRDYIKHCSVQRYSLAKSAFETDWSKYAFLLNYMNLELKQCGAKQMAQARQLCKDRKPWPDPSSIFIQDHLVILMLFQTDE